MSLVQKYNFDFNQPTQESIQAVAFNASITFQAITLLISIFIFRYFVETVAWTLRSWRRLFGFVTLVLILLMVYKVNSYVDGLMYSLMWFKSMPYTFVIDPIASLFKWFVAGWNKLTSIENIFIPKL